MNIDDVKDLLKVWVADGRALKANYIFIVLDKATQKHYPHYTFDEYIDGTWQKFDPKKDQPMISFNLNKKVLGVDDSS